MGRTSVLGGVLLLTLLHNPVQARSVTPPGYSLALAWHASPSPDVSGYRVYFGVASGSYTNSVVVGNVTSNTVSGLASGVTYFVSISAYTASGLESAFSNEISYVPGLPTVRMGLTATRQAVLTVKGLIGHTYEIQVTQDFTTWTVIGTVTLGASGSVNFTDPTAASLAKRFYRTRDTQP